MSPELKEALEKLRRSLDKHLAMVDAVGRPQDTKTSANGALKDTKEDTAESLLRELSEMDYHSINSDEWFSLLSRAKKLLSKTQEP